MQHHRSRRSGRIGIAVLLLAILLPILPAQSVGAATIMVDSLANPYPGPDPDAMRCAAGHMAGTCRLVDALLVTGSGNLITFSVDGTIMLTGGGGSFQVPQSVTVDATGRNITLDGGNFYTVFTVNGDSTVFTIKNLTIAHGLGGGGGILNTGLGTMNVMGCTFHDNATSTFSGNRDGGAIYNKTSGALNIANSTFFNNTAIDHGGAISNNHGTVTISGSTFTNNSATSSAGEAGAIMMFAGGTLVVANSVFDGNTSGGDAGAIIGEGTSTVTNSRFKNNIAKTGKGGGILAIGIFTVVNSTFDGNAAGADGGGIFASSATCTVVNSTFSNNSAPTGNGGAIAAINDATLTLTNSTLSGNSAMSGGGLSLTISTLSIGNTVVALDPNLTTPDIVAVGSGSTLQDRGHNLIGNPGALTFNQPGDITGQNPLLGGLQDNGGTTATLLPDGAHAFTRAITNTSPPFNHGDPAVCTAPLPPTGTGAGSMDERGFPRGNGAAGYATCSIGAFELYVVKPNPAPTPRPGGVIQGGMPKPLPPVLRPSGMVQGASPAPVPVSRR